MKVACKKTPVFLCATLKVWREGLGERERERERENELYASKLSLMVSISSVDKKLLIKIAPA